MAKRDKRLQKMRQNPQSITFEELRGALEGAGFTVTSVAGSHHNFRAVFGDQTWRLTVPYHKPHVKAFYVKEAVQLIDQLLKAKLEAEQSEANTEETDDDP